MNSEILRLFEEHKKNTDFSAGASESSILQLEQILNVTFPKSYKEFLGAFGGGSIYSLIIFGIEDSLENSTLYYENSKFKKLGLPDGFLVIVDVDEYCYCLDTNHINHDDECPVVIWSFSRPNAPALKAYENFNSFILDKLDDILDDL